MLYDVKAQRLRLRAAMYYNVCDALHRHSGGNYLLGRATKSRRRQLRITKSVTATAATTCYDAVTYYEVLITNSRRPRTYTTATHKQHTSTYYEVLYEVLPRTTRCYDVLRRATWYY